MPPLFIHRMRHVLYYCISVVDHLGRFAFNKLN